MNLKPVDWLTLFALILGPALAVGIQLWFSRRHEDRQRKLNVLDTLLAYRGRTLHTDNVRALNTVPLVFYKHQKVQQKFKALIDSFTDDGWNANPVPQSTITASQDALAELLSEMAKVLKYEFDHTEIKGQAYAPRAYENEQKYQLESRAAFLPILRGESPLRVSIEAHPSVPQPTAPQTAGPHHPRS
jgi:hypothetical protein